jgi:pilus assembly protein Flp/PilA
MLLAALTGEIPMSKFLTRFAKDESGATAIEYGLIAALIAVVIIGAVTALGSNTSDALQGVADAMGGE